MSSTYTPANTFHANITIPSDGDLADAGSVNAALEALADNYTYINNFITGFNPGADFLNAHFTSPTFSGAPISFTSPIHGDGTFLFLSQPGETTIVLGPSILSAGNTHRVDGNLNVVGTFHVASGGTGFVDAGGNLVLAGTTTVTGALSCAGIGHINYREIVGTDSNMTITVNDCDTIRTPGAFAAPRVWTIDTTGAFGSPRIKVVISPAVGSAQLTIQWRNTTPTVVGAITIVPNATNLGAFVEVEYDGVSAWHCIGASAGLAGSGF